MQSCESRRLSSLRIADHTLKLYKKLRGCIRPLINIKEIQCKDDRTFQSLNNHIEMVLTFLFSHGNIFSARSVSFCFCSLS